ncbi:MAG: lactonase family protein [Erysipelotrichaceae bacterium]|jgi:6-phosphogluconolactonase
MKNMIYAGSVGIPMSISKGKKQQGSISGRGDGVYAISLNEDYSMKIENVVEQDNAGIICLSPNKNMVYAANESRTFGGSKSSGGGLTAMRIKTDGTLEKINDSISYGSRTSMVAVSDDAKFLFASNHGSHSITTCHYIKNTEGKYELQRGYDDSSVVCFRLNSDGSIGEITDMVIFKNHGYWINGGGQSSSHLHSVYYNKGLIFCGNRGADEIEILRIDENGKFELLNQYKTKPALAPRHIAFHPVLDLIYVCNENYPCMSVYRVNYKNGELEELITIPTMPKEYIKEFPIPQYNKTTCDSDEKNTSVMGDISRMSPSDIHVSGNSRYCFVANRCLTKEGNIATFRLDDCGMPEFVGVSWLDGADPRGFNLLDNEHLIVGLLDKDVVKIYKIDKDGLLNEVKGQCKVPSVASFVFK